MTRRCWTTSLPRWPQRRGLTLIEVVAAIAILGTILVGIVIASSRHTQQRAVAARQQVAVRAAEAMLDAWWIDPRTMPRDASGVVEDHTDLHWRIERIDHASIQALGGEVVRFTIRDERADASGGAGWGESEPPSTLVAVELALPASGRPERPIRFDALDVRGIDEGGQQ